MAAYDTEKGLISTEKSEVGTVKTLIEERNSNEAEIPATKSRKQKESSVN